MSTNIVLNEKDSLIAHYFPNERIPGGCTSIWGDTIDYPGYDAPLNIIEEYCKRVWEWYSKYYKSRFIIKDFCIPKY